MLNQSIKFLSGVGDHRSKVLRDEAGIVTCEDLLNYYPYRHIDRSRFYQVREVHGKLPYIQLRGQIVHYSVMGEGRTERLVGRFTDGTGFLDLVFFRGIKSIPDRYKVNREYIIFGKPTEYGQNCNMVHPDIDAVEEGMMMPGGLMPLYNTTDRMKRALLHSRAIQKLVHSLLSLLKFQLPETLPAHVIEKRNLVSRSDAYRGIHFPASTEELSRAEERLKFEELFFIQLRMLRTAHERRETVRGLVFNRVGENFNTFYHDHLPFELTGAQKRVVREIRQDTGSGRQMNRLLQGDVGSGKTLVALLSMLLSLDNGYQACLMAPTEILAVQHFRTVSRMLEGMPLRVGLLTGSTPKRIRKELLPAIESGEVHILVGTHALIEETVVFKSLGMAVIDEQHRFGVAQRAGLWNKTTNVPHVLIMSATPIPRTLAMTLYGDLDVSVIDELPPGRKPIITEHRYDNKMVDTYAFLREQLVLGRQIYIVYPLIEESEKLDYKNLESGFETIKEVFEGYGVSMVHGRMKAADKELEMSRFISGETRILVATTVIEVGVDVPNASVMVIESAERFGLSQLHQLRGRVGRGGEQSYCILVSSYKLNEEMRKRLDIMVKSTDGFEIAEFDMKLRGHGDIEGTQQSGYGLTLRIASLATDGLVLQSARDLAQEILEEDPSLELPQNELLKKRIAQIASQEYNWYRIS